MKTESGSFGSAGKRRSSTPSTLAEPTLESAYADGRTDQFEEDKELLAWAYAKLVYRSFSDMDDCLNMDRIKLMFMGAL